MFASERAAEGAAAVAAATRMPISTGCGHSLKCRYNGRARLWTTSLESRVLGVPLTLPMGPDKGKAGASVRWKVLLRGGQAKWGPRRARAAARRAPRRERPA